MTILLAIICAISVVQFGLIIYLAMEPRYYSRTCDELVKIMRQQNILIGDSGKLVDHNSDVVSDLISTLHGLNKLVCEHDIKIDETNEWTTSVDDNIAEMRKDIQKILDKFDEDSYHYNNASTMKAKDINLQDLIDLNKIYYKSNMLLIDHDSEPDAQKGDEVNEQT